MLGSDGSRCPVTRRSRLSAEPTAVAQTPGSAGAAARGPRAPRRRTRQRVGGEAEEEEKFKKSRVPRIFSRGVRQRLINPVANSINVAAGPPTRRSAEDERRSTPRDPRASSTPAARRRAEASGCARRASLKVAGGRQRVGVEAEEVVAEALPFGLRAVSAL